MKKYFSTIGLGVVFATASTLMTFSYTASAHKTGEELRSRNACAGVINKEKRTKCRHCVSQSIRHHYHPKRWTGKKCMINGSGPWYKFGKDKK